MNARKHEMHMNNNERLAVLETTILNINSTLIDIKDILKHHDYRFDKLDQKIDTKFDILDKKIDTKFDILDKKIDTKFDILDRKIDIKISGVTSLIWSNFFWLMGLIIGLAGLVAHAHHWF